MSLIFFLQRPASPSLVPLTSAAHLFFPSLFGEGITTCLLLKYTHTDTTCVVNISHCYHSFCYLTQWQTQSETTDWGEKPKKTRLTPKKTNENKAPRLVLSIAHVNPLKSRCWPWRDTLRAARPTHRANQCQATSRKKPWNSWSSEKARGITVNPLDRKVSQ